MGDSRRINLFGRPRFDENGRTCELTYRKGQALLAYLGVTGKRHSRDSLAALLWPDYSQTRARANLRRTLYAVNQSGLGGWIEADPDSITLANSPRAQVDAVQFQALIERWQAHDHGDPDACQECAGLLQQASELYAADFLADFYLADSNPFEEWASLQREQLRRLHFHVLDALSAFYLASGDPARAQAVAYRQIESDNLNERAYRQLMVALAYSGQRSAALQAYDELEKLLQEELGVKPEGAVREVAEQIRAGEWEPAVGDTAPRPSPEGAANRRRPISPAPQRLTHSPYRGLYPFREEDAPLFFGREEFTEQLVAAVAGQSLVAVVGPSGSGKSSVVYAGLVAQLRGQPDLAIVSFRPTADPTGSLAGALLPWLQPGLDPDQEVREARRLAQALIDQETTLVEVLDNHPAGQEIRRTLLVADQFEELYTRCPDPAVRHRFLDILLEAIFDQQYRPDPRFTLVLTLRADFLGQALAYRPLADAMVEADVKLGPMTAAELDRAIERPALAHGVAFDPGLVTRIRDDVAGEPGNLPLLEFALDALWQNQENDRLIHAAYEAIGQVGGALTRYAEHVFTNLIPEEQTAARRIFIQLVRPGEGTEDTRRVASRAELGEADWTIAQDLADARLLTTGSDATGLETVEVVHEALINGWDRLRGWMIADREFRLWQERLRAALQQWQSSNRDDGALLRGVSLTIAEDWQSDRPADLSQAEIDFIQRSRELYNRRQAALEAEQQRSERFRRRLSYVGLVGLVVVSLLAIFALLQWRQAASQRQIAQEAEQDALAQLAARLAANARNLALDQLDVSLLLSAEANRLVDNDVTQSALAAALARNPALLQYGQLPFNPFAVTVKNGPPQPDNRLYLHVDGSSVVSSWIPDWQSARLRQEGSIPFPDKAVATESKILHHLASSQDDLLLAMVFCSSPAGEPCQEPQIALWHTAQAEFVPVDFHLTDHVLTAMALSPDGSWLAHGNVDGSIHLWDTSLARSIGRALVAHSEAVRLLAISPDGHWLASWSRDGLLSLWDISRLSFEPAVQFGGHSSATSLAFSPDSSLLLSAGQSDERLFVWEVEEAVDGRGNPSWRLDGPQGGSYLAEFSPDGRYLLAGGYNGQIFRWSRATLKGSDPVPTILHGHSEFVSAFFYNPDGIMLSLAPDASILWDLSGASLPRRTLVGHQQHVASLAFAPDERTLLSAGCDLVGNGGPCSSAEFLAWDITSAALLTPSIAGPVAETWATKLSSDGDLAFLGTADKALVLPNPVLATGTSERPTSLPSPLPHAFALSPDGLRLATGVCEEADLSIPRCLRSALILWDWPSGALQQQATNAHEGLIEDLAFSPDGWSLATAGEDGILLLWEITGGETTSRRINGAAEVVDDALAFSPDGSTLAGAGCGPDEANGGCLAGATWLWDVDSGQQVGGPLLLDETAFTFNLAFSPDGRYLVTVDGAGIVIFWSVATGERISQIQAHTGPVVAARFSHDGRYLASGGIDRTINLFNVDTLLDQVEQSSSEKVEKACLRAGRNLSNEEWSIFFGDVPYRITCPEVDQ